MALLKLDKSVNSQTNICFYKNYNPQLMCLFSYYLRLIKMPFFLQILCVLCFCILSIFWLKNYHGILNNLDKERITKTEKPKDWRTNIDFVIPWAGQPKSHINGTDAKRERYNSELPYLLRSIAKNVFIFQFLPP